MTAPTCLIDSNIIIYILRDSGCVAARRAGECVRGTLVSSSIVYAEVIRGIPIAEAKARESAVALFKIIPALPFEAQDADVYSQLPFKRHRFDQLIAAHALSRNLTLITNNETDFADIPGLRVENWTV